MKLLAFIFLSLVAFFTMQPLINSQDHASAKLCCLRIMKCHSTKLPAHSTKQPAKDNSNCNGDSCNPFMACAFGNFFLTEKNELTFLPIDAEKEKSIVADDNRLSSSLSESWHPPRFELLFS